MKKLLFILLFPLFCNAQDEGQNWSVTTKAWMAQVTTWSHKNFLHAQASVNWFTQQEIIRGYFGTNGWDEFHVLGCDTTFSAYQSVPNPTRALTNMNSVPFVIFQGFKGTGANYLIMPIALNTYTNFSLDYGFISLWCRTSGSTNNGWADYGCNDGSNYTDINIANAGSSYNGNFNSIAGIAETNSTTTGDFEIIRAGANLASVSQYRAGTIIGSAQNCLATAIPAYALYIGAMNGSNSASQETQRQYAFFGVGGSAITAAGFSTDINVLASLLGW